MLLHLTMICLCIGNVYSVFITLKIIQTYVSQQNDNGSFWVHSNICTYYTNTILHVYKYAIHKWTDAQSYWSCGFTIIIIIINS